MNKLSKNVVQTISMAYQIGDPLSEPTALVGGFLHSCWKIETQTGLYVVKKINEAFSDRKNQFQIAEEISTLMPNSISAIKRNGEFVFLCGASTKDDITQSLPKHNRERSLLPQKTRHPEYRPGIPLNRHDEIFLLFPYVNASILKQNEISDWHIHDIAKTLAKIHDQKIIIKNPPEVDIFSQDITYWKSCQSILKAHSINVEKNLFDQLSLLENIHEKYLVFTDILRRNLIISHRDMDPKNVLWDAKNNHYVIDWESAGLINRTKDLMATAIYWSLDEQYQIKTERLNLFIETYLRAGGEIHRKEIQAGLFGLLGDWLGWLDFNFSRMLNHETEHPEFILGESEAQKTLYALPILYEQFKADAYF